MRLVDSEAIGAAVDLGISIFDTAHAYGAAPGDNERLLAAALKNNPGAFIITKGAMALRPAARWHPRGR